MYLLYLFFYWWNPFTIDPFPMKSEFRPVEFQLFPGGSKENRVPIPGEDGGDDSLPPAVVVIGVDLIAKLIIPIAFLARGKGP